MSREARTYVVGDYWLSYRRDGKSPGIWQITRYSAASRSDIYRSTRSRDLEEAKVAIHAHVERERAKRPQSAEDAAVLPQLFLYWREHGEKAVRPVTIAGSLRAFIGFLMQDELGIEARFSQLMPVVFTRFTAWRMGPHSYTVPWQGRDLTVQSKGVKGESVQRNLDDIRAALNHAAKNGRVPYVPKVPSVPSVDRSPPRDVRLTLDELGAIIGYASSSIMLPDGKSIPRDDGYRQWLLLMLATACRPEAALAFAPAKQWRGELIDIHPTGRRRTKKRNPVVPAIEPFKVELASWVTSAPVSSRKTAWRTMRAALGLAEDVIPKTIRHTIATELRGRGVPGEEISGLLGHTAMNRTSEVYAKYDPHYLGKAKAALTTIYRDVMRRSERWAADHQRTKVGNGRVVIAKKMRNKPR